MSNFLEDTQEAFHRFVQIAKSVKKRESEVGPEDISSTIDINTIKEVELKVQNQQDKHQSTASQK